MFEYVIDKVLEVLSEGSIEPNIFDMEHTYILKKPLEFEQILSCEPIISKT